jgi:hypothetical protein
MARRKTCSHVKEELLDEDGTRLLGIRSAGKTSDEGFGFVDYNESRFRNTMRSA